MKDNYNVIRTLMRTEKGESLAPLNKYLFEVDRRSNKIEIRRAVEDLYNVKVKTVNVMNVPGKRKRLRYKEGMTSGWKKAIVTLKEGSKIETGA